MLHSIALPEPTGQLPREVKASTAAAVPGYRDLVIAELADAEAALREQVASLEADVATYRELTIAAVDALRHLAVQHQALQASSARLGDEYRALRERLLLSAGADDDVAA